MNGLEELHHGETFVRNAFFRHAPDFGNVGAVLRVLDVTRSGKLVAVLSLLASALAVTLAGDHGVTAAFEANTSGSGYEVDGGHAILHTLGMVLDTARVQQEAGLGRTPDFRSPHDHGGGYSGDLRRILRRVFADDLFHLLPSGGVPGDEFAIDPAPLDHHVQHSVKHTDVATGAHGNEQIRIAGDGRHSRSEDAQLR